MCVRQSYSCVMSQKRLERISSNLKQHPFELKKELIRLCWLEVKVTVTSWCLILLNTISQKCNEKIPSMLKRLLGLTFLQLIFFFSILTKTLTQIRRIMKLSHFMSKRSKVSFIVTS